MKNEMKKILATDSEDNNKPAEPKARQVKGNRE